MITQNNKDKNLSSFIEEVTGTSHFRVEADLGSGFVRLKSSEAERRQAAQDIQCSEDIVIELLRNARDAHAKRIYLATFCSESSRTITLIDDGDGIPETMHSIIFDPRVTSKLDTAHMDKWGMHGRGMALYSISVNATFASVIASEEKLGTSIQVISNTQALPEKRDQSSFPVFEVLENGIYAMRGPKNIIRMAAEFALEHRNECQVYCGSPTEIIATMYSVGQQATNPSEIIFKKNLNDVSLASRLSYAADENDLCAMAANLGLVISQRSAHRILRGEIKALPSLLDRLQQESMQHRRMSQKNSMSHISKPTIHVSNEDKDIFVNEIREAFKVLAESYYLNEDVDVNLRVLSDSLYIKIPLEPKE